ncbi:MAG: 3'-5' exonuclease, partial [Myxococcota bacterium]|nr:3'-5' exonuclease [Myxococcota bacterium]
LSRWISRADGKRAVTNLLHALELVHQHACGSRTGPAQLADWLRDARTGNVKLDEDARLLRLDSDAHAVTIVTAFKSKGLQYPIVWVPFAWDGHWHRPDDLKHTVLHDPAAPNRVLVDIGQDRHAPGKVVNLEIAKREKLNENMRLLYVALTRARHQCRVYWGPFGRCPTSPLAALFHARNSGLVDRHGIAEANVLALDEPGMLAELQAVVDGAPEDSIGLEIVGASQPGSWTPGAEQTELSAARFTRDLDRAWRRSSFSRLADGAQPAPDAWANPEAEGVDHDDSDDGTDTRTMSHSSTPSIPDDAPQVPLLEFPRGRDPGTCLHLVLEHVDFTDRGTQLRSEVELRLEQHGISTEEHLDSCTDGLGLALRTPLTGSAEGIQLSQLSRDDRLDELDFFLPVAGGYTPQGALSARRLARTFRRHTPSASSLHSYLPHLDALGFPSLRGFLKGQIDLVFRHGGRWYLADYKSNWMGDRNPDRSTALHYHPGALAQAMSHHHYHLQYHLYLVALHRFLKHRLEQYSYEQHMGGVYYLFLRGMVGPDTPLVDGQRCGVFHHRPPAALVEALDQLLSDPRHGDQP